MFHYINTYTNSDTDLCKIDNDDKDTDFKEDDKICVLCLEKEIDSNLEFFNYNDNEKYITIKQCLCCPDIHENCLFLFLNKSEETKCIICNKTMVILHKNFIFFVNEYIKYVCEIKKILFFIRFIFFIIFKNLSKIILFLNLSISVIFYSFLIYKNIKN
tara:strand:- start:928 stop:1404 length:477 start_codon:yes stop_codon:yes gene_type:complete